jgi:hypothetical protein
MEKKTIEERLGWLERMVGVYGFMLAAEGRNIEAFLRATIGFDLWLAGLSDKEWRRLWDEIAPSLMEEAQARGESLPRLP